MSALVAASLGALFGLAVRSGFHWMVAGTALAIAVTLARLAATLPRRSLLLRAVTTGPESITRLRLVPVVRRDDPDAFDWQARFEIEGKPLRGDYLLRREFERPFIAALLAHDATMWIETVAADGSVHRVKKSGTPRLALL